MGVNAPLTPNEVLLRLVSHCEINVEKFKAWMLCGSMSLNFKTTLTYLQPVDFAVMGDCGDGHTHK